VFDIGGSEIRRNSQVDDYIYTGNQGNTKPMKGGQRDSGTRETKDIPLVLVELVSTLSSTVVLPAFIVHALFSVIADPGGVLYMLYKRKGSHRPTIRQRQGKNLYTTSSSTNPGLCSKPMPSSKTDV